MSVPSNPLRIAVLGPPAAGKSEMAALLLAANDAGLEHVSLDEDVLTLCGERALAGPLSDDVVDEAIGRLKARVGKTHRALVELPYHDYVQLFHQRTLRLEDFDHIVVITAPLKTLLHRNRNRSYQVPDPYIARCYGATAALVEVLRGTAASWILLDSELIRPQMMAELVDTLVRQRTSRNLAQLEVVPVPETPYIGGHLATEVEWSVDLVVNLLLRYPLHTALDVGCGLGLTLDRFAELGVRCWGLEGNPRVLDGPCLHKERLFIVDFHKQWVDLPGVFDLVWCVEVLEHVPPEHEENVVQTIVRNAGRLAFVSAAAPGQPGYFHVNCRSRAYWIERFEAAGLRYLSMTEDLLRPLTDRGPFGMNALKANGILLEVTQ